MENDIGYNTMKEDKNLYNCWREFKNLLQGNEFSKIEKLVSLN